MIQSTSHVLEALGLISASIDTFSGEPTISGFSWSRNLFQSNMKLPFDSFSTSSLWLRKFVAIQKNEFIETFSDI